MITNNKYTAIVCNKKYNCYKTFNEMNDDNCTVIRADINKESSCILMAIYINPDERKRILIEDTLNKIKAVGERYKNSKLIIFGDFNLRRGEFKRTIEYRLGQEYDYYKYLNGLNNFTSKRVICSNVEMS